MKDVPPEVMAEVDAALEEQGLEPAGREQISAFHGRAKRDRYTLRVDCEDGRTIKARRFATSAEAQRLCELREGLEAAFSPVIARHGSVLIEAWVPGATPGEAEAAARAEEAGALLGRLHARPLADGEPREQETRRYRQRAEAELASLSRDGRLGGEEADALLADLERHDPTGFRAALIHRDFCAENFVVDEEGQLAVIDNEWFEVGAPGFDLGRTFHRWPMPGEAWAEFRRGHSSTAPDIGPLRFWMVSTTLYGAGILHKLDNPGCDDLLELLREMAAGREPYAS